VGEKKKLGGLRPKNTAVGEGGGREGIRGRQPVGGKKTQLELGVARGDINFKNQGKD